MNNILSEKEYQHFVMDRLSQDNGYIIRKATSYDRLFAMDRELLFQFLNDTQPDEMGRHSAKSTSPIWRTPSSALSMPRSQKHAAVCWMC